MAEALKLARTANDADSEIEALAALILTSRERHDPANARQYLVEAQQKLHLVRSPVVKVLYLRAKARVSHDERDSAGEENCADDSST